jgi:DNA repair protein RadC
LKYQIVSERSTKFEVRISRPEDAYEVVKRYRYRKQEIFCVISLDAGHQVIRCRIATIGLVNRTLVHSREIYRQAIVDNATAIIAAHLHPSGNVEPSADDDEITFRLIDSGDLLGIPVLDHIVFSKKAYYSYLEHDRMTKR